MIAPMNAPAMLVMPPMMAPDEELERLEELERIRADEGVHHGEQPAGEAGEGGADGKRRDLGRGDVDAERPRR